MEKIMDLLLEEAISNYIVAIIMTVAGAAGWILSKLYQRSRPTIVTVEKWIEGPAFELPDEIKDRVQITYVGQAVDNLYHSLLRVKNGGEAPAEDITLYFNLEGLGPDDFLDVTLTNVNTIQRLTAGPLGDDHEVFTLDLPFLNPWKEHEDYLDIEFYAGRSIVVTGAQGNGPGWSAKYVDKARPMAKVIGVFTRDTGGILSVLARMVYRLAR
jgi:hypothetical protein